MGVVPLCLLGTMDPLGECNMHQSLVTTHIGGQDATRPQVFIVDDETLACVNNTQLLLYKVASLSSTSEEHIVQPYVLHSSKSFKDNGGISAVAVDRDYELIAVCGRCTGKPAGEGKTITVYISINPWNF